MNHLLNQLLIITIISGILSGCSSSEEQKAWEEGSATNNMESYEQYLSEFPDGKHADAAHDSIQKILWVRASENPADLLQITDQYIKSYPGGAYIRDFEELVYEQAKEENTVQAFEDYLQRFPEGEHAGEFESVLFNSIMEGGSRFTFEDYLQRYPNGKHVGEIEQALYDSLLADPSIQALERYKNLFPEGEYIEEVETLSEDIYYENTVVVNRAGEFSNFTDMFPESRYIASVTVSSDPEKATLQVTDRRGREIMRDETPATFPAVEGTTLVFEFTMKNHKPDSVSYVVGADSIQEFTHKLKINASFVLFDDFEGQSRWEANGSNYTFTLTGEGALQASTSKSQHQHIRNVGIDFSTDFILETSFRFTGEPNESKSYFGFLWGSQRNLRYFFLTPEGKYNFGDQSDRYRSGENENGYSKWNNFSGARDTWPSASTFRKNGSNLMIVEKKGNVMIYKLNGLKLYQENIFSAPDGKAIGMGIGNTEVTVDYLRVIQ